MWSLGTLLTQKGIIFLFDLNSEKVVASYLEVHGASNNSCLSQELFTLLSCMSAMLLRDCSNISCLPCSQKVMIFF